MNKKQLKVKRNCANHLPCWIISSYALGGDHVVIVKPESRPKVTAQMRTREDAINKCFEILKEKYGDIYNYPVYMCHVNESCNAIPGLLYLAFFLLTFLWSLQGIKSLQIRKPAYPSGGWSGHEEVVCKTNNETGTPEWWQHKILARQVYWLRRGLLSGGK